MAVLKSLLPVGACFPATRRSPKTHLATFNARIESVAKAYTYHWPFVHRRCLVPAAGWYEWESIEIPGQKKPRKQPLFIHGEDGHPLAFAGLWDRWQKGD
jgi:putative SOS response-associated peptidase YedK